MSRPKLLILEFNELCPALLDRWMQAGELPNFKRFHQQSEVFISLADAEAPALEPWIQWYSLHTGLPYSQHGVFRLTDGPRAGHPDIWQTLREAGLRTANICGMNSKGFSGEGSIFLPDPWCTSETPHPPELRRFHGFVARMVQEYTNRDSTMNRAAMVKFLWYLATHGLKANTILDILRVLYDEKFSESSSNWKRAFVLDWMQRDLFFHYFKTFQPDFSTFFLNSTAHLQHTYWRHMDPDSFKVRPSQEDLRRYAGAILAGYKNMDRLIGDFFALEQYGVTLVFATALSQQPFLKYEDIGGQHFYRPRNIDGLLARLGIRPTATLPVMTHQYMLRFNSQSDTENAANVLASVKCQEKAALLVEHQKDGSIYIGSVIRTLLPEDAELRWHDGLVERSAKFFDEFYMIDQTKSGMHHPDGCLWFKTGNHRVHTEKVSILDVFPTILEFFSIEQTATAAQTRPGRSLRPWRMVEQRLAS